MQQPKRWRHLGTGGLLMTRLLATAGAEERTTLNGIWDFAAQTEYVRPTAYPERIYVPSFWNHPETFGYPEAWRTLPAGWFRRTVAIPAEWRHDRIALRFEGIYMTGQVFLNGQHVANTWDALNPVTLEVTPWVRWGETNEIVVGVREAIAESDELLLPFDPTRVGAMFQPGGTRTAKARALVPYGSQATGEYRQNGLARDVWLIRSAAVYVENVAVRTSVREHELVVDYDVRNATAQTCRVLLAAQVTARDQEHPLLKLPRSPNLEIAPGALLTITLRKTWRDAELWDPDHPNLYDLQTTLTDATGALSERSRQRFGFRETWAQGRDLFLNGNKLVLRADSLMVHGSTQFYEDSAFRELCRLYRRMNVNAVRFHCHCNTLRMLEICDEEGLMVIAESGLHGSCGDQALDDPRFWENAATHLRTQVRTERNHPCIVGWSVENEIGGFLQQTQPVAWEKLSALTRVVKTHDPTRLAWHEGFAYGFMDAHRGTPVENDLLALHYPVGPEAWALYYNVPESTYWAERLLRQPDGFGGLPVGIGEYAMAPPTVGWETDGTCHQPLHQAPWLGERPTTWPSGALRWHWDLHWYALAFSLRGNRAAGTAYISPFTIVQHYLQQSGGAYPDLHAENRTVDWETPGIKLPVLHPGRQPLLDLSGARPPYQWLPMIAPVAQAYHPLLVFPRQHNLRFWSGTRLRQDLVVFNDLYRPSRLQLDVEVQDDTGAVLDQQRLRPRLPPGEHRDLAVALRLPEVEQRTAIRLHIRHASSQGPVFEDTLAATVFPPIPVPEFVLVDPSGSTAQRFTEAGLRFTVPAAVTDLHGAGTPVVLAEGCLPSLTAADLEALRQCLEHGRTVVCLAQTDADAYAAAWGAWATLEPPPPRWPYQPERGPIPTTVAHPTGGGDPVTTGLTPEDLRFWAAQHAVAVYGLCPSAAPSAAATLVLCNRPRAADTRALLMRVQQGSGTLFLCQLLLADNLRDEPIARLLLARLLSAAATAAEPTPKASP